MLESRTAHSGVLNVRDFGAKGDGVTDDSDAIQRALLQAAKFDTARGFLYWRYAPVPEVFFPRGTYKVTRTLLVPICGGKEARSNHLNLRGDNATIRQTDSTQDIFYFQQSHRNLIEGLTFEGGRRQIKIWSRNMDEAIVIIRDCTFRNSSGFAIDDRLHLDPAVELKDWYHNVLEPYHIRMNEKGLPILTAIDESRYPMCLFVSTGMRISDCRFERCMKVLSVWADWALMDDCHIETNPNMNGPAILSGAALMLENVTGLAHVTEGKEQWWITIDPGKQPSGIAALDLQRVRLKTAAGKGMCVVRNEAKFTGGCHVYIIADGCEFQSAGSKENCVIYLAEGPNLINIRNSRETSGRTVNLFNAAKPFDPDYFAGQTEIFSYLIEDNNRNLVNNLPKNMQAFADKQLPKAVAQDFKVKQATPGLPRMRKGIASRLNVRDFGATGNGATDDSAAFRKAFAAARRKAGLVEVLIPAGSYLLGETLELPPRIVIRGVGLAALTVPAGRKGAIFTAPNAEHIVVQSLHFFNCEQSLKITTKATSRSNILVDYCKFYRNSGDAISCLSGTGAVAEPNQTTLRMSNCTFSLNNCSLLSNANYAVMDNPWISTSPDAADGGAIVNKGFFHLKALIGVPRDTMQHWVDNYDRLFIDRCRFGGEGGGLPMVRNLSAKGRVLVQNSWLMIYASPANLPKTLTYIDCPVIPEVLALRGNWGWPFPASMVTVRKEAHGELAGHFFESGNTAPRVVKDERKGEAAPKPASLQKPATPAPAKAKYRVSAKTERGTGNLPKEIRIDLGNGVSTDLILVSPGSFNMGSSANEAGHRENENQHRVRITRPFYLGKHEVTQAVWEKVMTQTDPRSVYWPGFGDALDFGSNPRPAHFSGLQRPVENVSWRECKEFLARLNSLVEGGGFRLPTEAEWEYAARAGSRIAWSFDQESAALADHAWYDLNSDGETHAVGSKQPNAWGFYDMHGNVREWCEDRFTGARYPVSPGEEVPDPALYGDLNGNEYQVVRGGSYALNDRMSRSANRSGFDPWHHSRDIGLRLVKTVPAADHATASSG